MKRRTNKRLELGARHKFVGNDLEITQRKDLMARKGGGTKPKMRHTGRNSSGDWRGWTP